MVFVDTHTHLYQPDFDNDRDAAVLRSINSGVSYLLMPNIDLSSVERMLSVAEQYPANCFPMMGLHPGSVKENFEYELSEIEKLLCKGRWCAVGETGIDLYWDKSFAKQQEIVFRTHIEWAIQYDLPLVIHSRNSFNEIIRVLKDYASSHLSGVFHCFPGSTEQAREAIKLNFMLGIGGVVSFKNSKMAKLLSEIDLKHIVLETDSPYLAPTPYRGKRNESSYIRIIARHIADIKGVSLETVAEITTQNTFKLFKIE